MYDENGSPKKRNFLKWLDDILALFIPNFNIRAILYLSLIFAVAISLQFWRISSPRHAPEETKKETIVADQKYWDGSEYKDKLKSQTVESFAKELQAWFEGKNQELTKRKFEDLMFINGGLDPTDLAILIPENFNYLENNARARYRYAKEKGFLADTPALVSLGTVVCDINEKTEKVTGMHVYDWRYASMQKLTAFLKTKPDWKYRIGDRIFDVSDPRVANRDKNPTGVFSFLIFRDPKTNRITIADSMILEKNGIDAKSTLDKAASRKDKQIKLHFKPGYNGCANMTTIPNVPYGDID